MRLLARLIDWWHGRPKLQPQVYGQPSHVTVQSDTAPYDQDADG